MARLIAEYREKIVPLMMDEHKYQSVMQVPRIQKITINMGLGEAIGDKKGPGACGQGHDGYCWAEACGHRCA